MKKIFLTILFVTLIPTFASASIYGDINPFTFWFLIFLAMLSVIFFILGNPYGGDKKVFTYLAFAIFFFMLGASAVVMW